MGKFLLLEGNQLNCSARPCLFQVYIQCYNHTFVVLATFFGGEWGCMYWFLLYHFKGLWSLYTVTWFP